MSLFRQIARDYSSHFRRYTVSAADMALAQNEQFIPRLVYRSGPYAPNGIPFADGYVDYLDLINARDGGVNGVKITYGGVRNRVQQRQGRRVL